MKIPKGNIPAEETLLGTIIYYPNSFKDVCDELNPDDFSLERTIVIFKGMLSLQQNNQAIDLLNLMDILSRNGGLSKIGGKEYLASLVGEESVGTSAIIPYLIDEIKAAAKKRNAELSLLQAQDKIKSGEPIDEALSEATTSLEALKEEPIEDQTSDPVVFPDVMTGVAGKFANLYSTHLEPPAHFFYMSFLTCLGSILSGSLTLPLETDPQPRLYTILLGESADDRKSTTLIKVTTFFRDTIEGFSTCLGVGSAEGLQIRLKKNRKLLLCFDEFKQFINKCKIEGSVLLPCVNSLFELNRFESNTKTTNVDIDDAHLAILAASTIQTYERIWTASFTDIGFTNRLFLVPGSGRREFSLPGRVPDKERKALKGELAGILIHVGDGLELPITQEARDIFQDWYMNLETSIHTKRLEVYATRLMPLLAVNELKLEVDKDIIEKAIALANWQFEVRQEHDPIDADNTIAEMEERIRRYLRKEPLTERDLRVKLHRIIGRSGSWYFMKAIKNLREGKEIYPKRGERVTYLQLKE